MHSSNTASATSIATSIATATATATANYYSSNNHIHCRWDSTSTERTQTNINSSRVGVQDVRVRRVRVSPRGRA